MLGLFLTTFARGQEVVWTETFLVNTNDSYDKLFVADFAGDGHGGLIFGASTYRDPDIRFTWFGPTGDVVGHLWMQKLDRVFTRVAIIQANRKRVAIQVMESRVIPPPSSLPNVPFSNSIWSLTKTKSQTKANARYLRSLTRERRSVPERLRDHTGYFVLTPIVFDGRQVGITITRYAGSPPP